MMQHAREADVRSARQSSRDFGTVSVCSMIPDLWTASALAADDTNFGHTSISTEATARTRGEIDAAPQLL